MALVVKDRVRENSTTTGTGTLTLTGAVSGFQTFSSAIGNTNTTYYAIVNGTEWEVGLGTVGAGTLSRDTILESSNAGSVVNLSAGTKDVFVTYPAERSTYNDTTLTINGTAYDLSANRSWTVGNVNSGTATNFTAQQYFGNVNLTDAATISWAVGSAQVATVTIAGNRTFGAPTGLVDGGFYALCVIQDGTGSRTISWNSVFKWDSGTAPILSTAANARDCFIFRSNGTNLYEQGRSLGVA